MKPISVFRRDSRLKPLFVQQHTTAGLCISFLPLFHIMCSIFCPEAAPCNNRMAVLLTQEEPIRGFHVAEQLPFLKDLEKRHRKTVLSDMMNITRPWCCWKLSVKLLVLSSGHYDKPWSYWKLSVKLFVVFTLLWHENYHHILKPLKTVSEIKVAFASLWLEHHKV